MRGLNIPSDIFHLNILYNLEKNSSMFLNDCASWRLYGCWGSAWWGNKYNSIYKHMQRTLQYPTGYMACWGNCWSCQPCIIVHTTWNKSHCLPYSRCCMFQIMARRLSKNIPEHQWWGNSKLCVIIIPNNWASMPWQTTRNNCVIKMRHSVFPKYCKSWSIYKCAPQEQRY